MLLADDESNVRFALRVLLEQRLAVQVVGEATDVNDLLNGIKTACPDVVLLDWGFGDGATIDLLSLLRTRCPNLAVIVLSGHPEAREAALAAGADAFVSKADPPEQLLTAIRSLQSCDSSSLEVLW
jgi:DNA-binding NarL/FixJ family response regulator